MRILVVVFAGGEQRPENAAAEAVRRVAAAWDPDDRDGVLDIREVPRVYQAAGTEVCRILRETRPHLFLLYDTAPRAEDYKLHHLAANYDDDPAPDDAGEVRIETIIDPDGPVAYRTRLPLDGIWDKLLVERVPVRMSHKAVHVFNHIYYRAMQVIHDEDLPTLGGAIESPPSATEGADDPTGRAPEALEDETLMVLAVLRQLYPAALQGAASG